MIIYLLIILAIGAAIAIIPCGLVWWLTKKLSIGLRLLFTTLVAALICTPAGVAGEGGAGIVPVIFVLIDFNRDDPTTSHAGMTEIISIAVVWGVLFFISIALVGIYKFFAKKKSVPPK